MFLGQGRIMTQQSALTTGAATDSMTAGPATEAPTERLVDTDQGGGSISVDLLGGLRVRAGETTMGPREFGGAKPRRILLALLLQRGAPISKDRLVSMLWEGSPPSCAKATLEAYICVLRKKLQPREGVRSSLITTVAGCYAIDMSRVDLDVLRYERLISSALQPTTSASDALPMLYEAMALARLPLLPEEIDSDWLDDARRSHSENVHKHLIAAANKVAGLQCGSAVIWAGMALQGDPLNESAWHALLASLEANGQHADGLQAYDQCRRLFAEELGCAPGPGLQKLYVRLLRGANEDNEELSQLLDAVVRLHMASQLGGGPPAFALDSGISDKIGQTSSVDQAFRALNLLLRNVGRGGTHFVEPLGA
jgi:SARP family transcriptional regulator, regulator of embCAB operon